MFLFKILHVHSFTAEIDNKSEIFFKDILHKFGILNSKIDNVMAKTEEQFNSLVEVINGVADNISADLDGLKAAISGQGLSAEAEERVFAKLEAVREKYQGIAASTPEAETPSTPGEETPVTPGEPTTPAEPTEPTEPAGDL